MDQIAETPVQTQPPSEIPTPADSLRQSYDNLRLQLDEIKTHNPETIVNITSPDELNGDMTLEQIEARWTQVSVQEKHPDEAVLLLYEGLRDYLVLPRIVDRFPNTPDGHTERRQFKKSLYAQNHDLFIASGRNDLRLNNIFQVLAVAEYYLVSSGNDSSDFYKKITTEHSALFGLLTEENTPDSKETYSTKPLEQKIEIANRIRKFARTLYFSDLKL